MANKFRFGKGSYCCGQRIGRPTTPKPVAAPKRAQDVAAEKAARARKMIAGRQTRIARAAATITRLSREIAKWETSARFQERRAAMSDTDIINDAAKRKAARTARPARRGMKLTGD